MQSLSSSDIQFTGNVLNEPSIQCTLFALMGTRNLTHEYFIFSLNLGNYHCFLSIFPTGNNFQKRLKLNCICNFGGFEDQFQETFCTSNFDEQF